MRNVDIDFIKKHYDEQLELNQLLMEKLLKAIPVMEQFNGKVVNVRLQRALSQQDTGLRIFFAPYTQTGEMRIEVRIDKAYYGDKEKRKGIAGLYKESTVYDIPTQNGRIDGLAAIEAIKKHIQSMKEENKGLLEKKQKLETTVALYVKLCEAITAYQERLDYITRDYINIEGYYK